MQPPLILDMGTGLLAVRAEPLGQDGWLRVFRLASPKAPGTPLDADECGEEVLRLVFSDHKSLSVVLGLLQRQARTFLWRCSACGTALGAAGRRCGPCAATESERCAEPGSDAWVRAAHRRFVAGLALDGPDLSERVEIAEGAAKYWRSSAESSRRSAETWRGRTEKVIRERDEARQLAALRYEEARRQFDCCAQEPCGACTTCLMRALEVATRERDEAQQLAARRYDCAGAACEGCMTCLAMDDEERERLTRERDEARAALQEALADPPEGPDLRLEVWARRTGKVRTCALKTFPTHEERGALRDHFRRAAHELEADLDAMDRGEWRQVLTGDGDETPPARLVRATVEPGSA